MPSYTVQYQTTMYYEVVVDADTEADAKAIAESMMGDDKPYDIDSDITGVYKNPEA